MVNYSQPVFYGIFESRVTLMILAYFPLKDLIKSRLDRLVFLLNTTVVILFFVAFLGLLLKVGLVSITNYYSFGTSGVTGRGNLESAEVLRGDRLATGRFVIIFSIIYVLTTMIHAPSLVRGWIVLVALFELVFVLQERQSILGVSVVLLYLVFHGWLSLSVRLGQLVLIVGGCTTASLLYMNTNFISEPLQLLNMTLQSDFTVYARFETAQTVFENMFLFLGHGALSLIWQDGFHRIFSERFFIGDVGWFGTAFRLGLVSTC